MRIPPRAKKCQEILDEVESIIEYAMSGRMDGETKKKFQYLRDYINEISIEKKVTEIKMAAKIKKEIFDE